MHLFGSHCCSEGGKFWKGSVHCPLVTCVSVWCCSSTQEIQHMHSEFVFRGRGMAWTEPQTLLAGVKGATQGQLPLLWSLPHLTHPLLHSTGSLDKVNRYTKQRSSGCSLHSVWEDFLFSRSENMNLNIKLKSACVCQFIRSQSGFSHVALSATTAVIY